MTTEKNIQKNIILIGINHNTADIEIREKFSLATFCEPEAQTFAKYFKEICTELFIVSTCNRVEILALVPSLDAEEDLIRCWAELKNESTQLLKAHSFVLKNEEAIKHLFAVASSLDSLVLGEPQILGQLKQAYKKCIDSKSVGTISTRLLHKSFSVAKRVRTETSLANSAVSISYAAVELAKRIFTTINENTALVIGAGEMAELAALHLKQAGVQNIFVANRTLANAEELANKIGGIAIPFDKMKDYLVQTDIIISSTGATHTILCANDIKPILRARKNKAMFFIDIAMPRDIEPDVNNLDNVYLYDIDDLKEVVEENMAQRRAEADKAWEIVKEETEDFLKWVKSLEYQPTIVSLNQKTEFLIQHELERTLKKLNLTQEQLDELEKMKVSLVKKINHAPLTYLKTHHTADKAISHIQKVFGLE